jgi:hypothetical protein
MADGLIVEFEPSALNPNRFKLAYKSSQLSFGSGMHDELGSKPPVNSPMPTLCLRFHDVTIATQAIQQIGLSPCLIVGT